VSSLDARYDQERKTCPCGGAYFLALTVGPVHVTQTFPFSMVLPPERAADLEVLALPRYECVACGTRYDQLWRAVI
jgi:hypothetical protein